MKVFKGAIIIDDCAIAYYCDKCQIIALAFDREVQLYVYMLIRCVLFILNQHLQKLPRVNEVLFGVIVLHI